MNDFDPRNQRFEQRAWNPDGDAFAPYRQATAAEVSTDERMAFVRKVYALFFAATLFAIGGVALGFMFPEAIILPIARHPYIAFFVMLGGIMGAQAVRHVPGVNLLALFGFTTLTGAIISPFMFWVALNNPASILQAGVLTVGIFGGLTLYVFVTKKDFDFMRGMLMTGLMVLVVAALLNFFALGSSALGFGVAAVSLLLFSGFVLYDTSKIIRRYPVNEYIAGALDLYLDAFNIFLALLRILNAGRR